MKKLALTILALVIIFTGSVCYKTLTLDTSSLQVIEDRPLRVVTYELPSKKVRESYEEYYQKQIAKREKRALEIAEGYVGKRGDCYKIAKAFIQEFKGFRFNDYYKISKSEVQVGDLIYYKNGGLGITHWAVYLSEDLALHGNTEGKAIIGSIKLPHASRPIYYRPIERETK